MILESIPPQEALWNERVETRCSIMIEIEQIIL